MGSQTLRVERGRIRRICGLLARELMEIPVQSLLDRFDISPGDLSVLQQCGQVLGTRTIEGVVDRFHEWLLKQPEYAAVFNSEAEVDRV